MRFLLDDVWTNETWNSLATSFPDDFTQSRIILTSRLYNVAPRGLLVNGESHSLHLREDHECLEILTSKLFPEKGWPLELAELGTMFAAKCKGLPLTTAIVAGLLATRKKEDWKRILGDLSSGVVSAAEQCSNLLELSYKHLSNELQHCFLYFGVFPEDYVVLVSELIQLWMAEGLVKNDSAKKVGVVAQGYLTDLIERNLVMISKRRSTGGAKTCRIHDVLHDFCIRKAKHNSFFHLLQRYDQLSDFNEPYSLQRLCIHSEPIHFKRSRLFCPRAHSLLFFTTKKTYENYIDTSFIIQIFKLVKVSDMRQFCMLSVITSEIQLLNQLKYLAINSIGDIFPSWIYYLFNLETFLWHLWSSKDISMPDSFWNLHKLRYFRVSNDGYFIHLPTENLENSPILSELETLSGVVIDSNSMEKQMRKFPNIRGLKCYVKLYSNSTKFVTIGQLESLSIISSGRLICECGSTEKLRKILLRGLELSRDAIAVIGNVPNLEILNLESLCYTKDTLEMEEGQFSKLKVLEVNGAINLRRWTTSDEQGTF